VKKRVDILKIDKPDEIINMFTTEIEMKPQFTKKFGF